ncbi:MAG: RdgB/HAM1 family non-canonical purine NTP pyrophosphatase [Kangiellaceae bacterium]|nr:RdgB/HAM1 family non-canonical purine NTP pyrophosphatase [Kangiellaceae bacterium]MCW9000929.1 RdgB/HAM1 family non-canonical purine NTP pyrophosphatase [Kangiellaceae bacterium]
MDKIVLASGNKKKLRELSQILNNFRIELIPQSEFNVEDAVEDGLTFVENAIKKARHACQLTGLPAIADDSGIEVDFLNGRPGIYSARFAGENASDEDNLQKLLESIQNAPESQRTARYQCVIVFMRHAEDPTPIICQAHWQGRLLDHKVGDGGFGYDPIFFCEQRNKTAAQMTPEEKSTISHRGLALAKFQQQFSKLYN